MDRWCVLLEVGPEFLCTVNINNLHTMLQAGWWPVSHGGYPVSILGHCMWDFWWAVWQLERVFLKAHKISPVVMIPFIIRSRLYLNTAGQVGEAWRPSNQVMLFGVKAGRRMFMLTAASHAMVWRCPHLINALFACGIVIGQTGCKFKNKYAENAPFLFVLLWVPIYMKVTPVLKQDLKFQFVPHREHRGCILEQDTHCA